MEYGNLWCSNLWLCDICRHRNSTANQASFQEPMCGDPWIPRNIGSHRSKWSAGICSRGKCARGTSVAQNICGTQKSMAVEHVKSRNTSGTGIKWTFPSGTFADTRISCNAITFGFLHPCTPRSGLQIWLGGGRGSQSIASPARHLRKLSRAPPDQSINRQLG